MAQAELVRRETVDFQSRGTRYAATLYRPDESATSGDPPVVVMAHGFGLPKRFGLPAVAERFTDRGLAAMVFDYRSLGESDGDPRNVVLPLSQVADWRAAVTHARTLEGVAGDRVGVWGFSLGGGGAFTAAAREDVDVYVGRCPILDGTRTLVKILREMGPMYGLRTTAAALRDVGRKYTGREPYYLPIWGDYPDELPALPTPGSKEGHEAVAGADAHNPAVNRCAARVFLQVGRYDPINVARRVECPALIVEAARDQLAASSAIEAAVHDLKDVRWQTYETDHFGPFFAPLFDDVVEQEGSFLEHHLADGT